MLGRTHATAGTALALAGAPALAHFGVPADPLSVGVMAIAAAGGAMLPDLDHRHATIAQSLGPVTQLIASGVGFVSGGHRNGTHSLLGAAFFVGLSWWLVSLGGWPLAIWLGLLVAFGSAALQVRFSRASIVIHTLTCLVLGWFVVTTAVSGLVPLDLVTWGVGIGALSHLLTDGLTKQGVPLFLPFSKARFKLANLTTGQLVETRVVAPVLTIIACAMVAWYGAGILHSAGMMPDLGYPLPVPA